MGHLGHCLMPKSALPDRSLSVFDPFAQRPERMEDNLVVFFPGDCDPCQYVVIALVKFELII